MADIEAARVAVPGLGAEVFYDALGNGPALVMCHAARGARVHFRWNGLAEALGSDYRVILIDALAHGDSDAPLEVEAYGMPQRVAQVTAVLDALGIDRAHYLGYSMGGHTGFGMALHAPERLVSLMIGGMGPAGPAREGTDWGQYTDAQLRKAAQKGNAIAAVAAALSGIEDLAEAFARSKVPALLFCGEHDGQLADARRGAALAGARLIELPNMGHRDVYKHGCRTIVPELRRFMADHSGAAAATS